MEKVAPPGEERQRMTITHAILIKAGVLLAIPLAIFLIAFLVALSDFIYDRIFATKTSEIPKIPPFLGNPR
jgi:hypothetical protein